MRPEADILIVDDNEANREVLARRLERRGYSLRHAADGVSALAAIAAQRPDLVLLDMMMPGMSGGEVLAELRQRYSDAALPVIMVTANDATEAVVDTLNAGANDFITKPINFAVALARIEAQVRRKLAEDRIRRSEERLALVLRGSSDGMWDWDLETNDLFLSERWREMLGLPPQNAATRPEDWFDRAHPADLGNLRLAVARHIEGLSQDLKIEYRLRHQDGSWRWMLLRGTALRGSDGRARRLAGSQSDITDRKLIDPVSGLPNRNLFEDRVGTALINADAGGDNFAVAVISLGRYRQIQEGLGPSAADAAMAETAQRILKLVRPIDTVCRLGENRIGILLDRLGDLSRAEHFLRDVLERLADPLPLPGERVDPAPLAGLVIREERHADAEALLRDAISAQQQARADEQPLATFEPEAQSRARSTLRIQNDLARAIETDAFAVAYQPIVNLSNGRCAGFEALVRWDRDGTMVSPAEFIPVAEETGQIVALGAHVLRRAAEQAAKWRLGGHREFTVSVNVSVRELARPNYAASALAAVEAARAEPKLIKLEVTESAIAGDIDRLRETLGALRDAGFRLSLDDFGTGYSALWLLPHLPIDTLKVDRSFVHGMTQKDSHRRLVESIVRMAHALSLDVVAEGIETEPQMTALRRLRCEYGQGYLFAKPMPAGEAGHYLSAASLMPQPNLVGAVA